RWKPKCRSRSAAEQGGECVLRAVGLEGPVVGARGGSAAAQDADRRRVAALDLRDGGDRLEERRIAEVRDDAGVGADGQALQALGAAQALVGLLEVEARGRQARR